jgi:hypothetical protein
VNAYASSAAAPPRAATARAIRGPGRMSTV